MVSAICPLCRILVVEANDRTIANLATAVNEAASMGAFAVSNSYALPEVGLGGYAAAYNHPGVVITAGAGDDGFNGRSTETDAGMIYYAGPQVPAAFSTVIAVGGTVLTPASNARGWSEKAWNDLSIGEGAGGSGCSTVVPKPVWQKDTGCAGRTIPDIAFTGEWTYNGVAIYAGLGNGWWSSGGTSAGGPAVAAIYALAGYAPNNASDLYANAAKLNAVTSGTNGTTYSDGSCVPPASETATNIAVDLSSSRGGFARSATAPLRGLPAYLCTAGVGYNGPAGNGTPNGTSAFTAAVAPVPTPTPAPTATPTSVCSVPTSAPATSIVSRFTPRVHPTQSASANPCTS